VALENATDDMDQMAKLLDELDTLQQKAEASDMYNIDVNINKMMPELGFTADDADRLVASYSGGWQMRIALGKILLQVRLHVQHFGAKRLILDRECHAFCSYLRKFVLTGHFCTRNLICCCWMSLRIIWTWTVLNGWRGT
jgi:ABC-type hemin transport system ATPase subunit